jgi:hypothetical protein
VTTRWMYAKCTIRPRCSVLPLGPTQLAEKNCPGGVRSHVEAL